MKRGNGIVPSLRLIRSFLLCGSSPYRLSYLQVSRYHHFFSPLSSSSSKYTHHHFISSTQQKLYFTSVPHPIATINEWSEGLENDLLEKFHSTPLTHEAVVYILKTLNYNKSPQKAFTFFNWVCDKHGFRPNSIVCNLMLIILSTNQETLKECEDFILKMWEEGFDVEERTHHIVIQNFTFCNIPWKQYLPYMPQGSAKDASVVRGLAHVILRSDWNDNVKKKLEKFKGNLSEVIVMRVFNALRADPLKALYFFLWLRDNAGYTHNAVTYNGILRIIWKKKFVEEFWCVVREMKGAGYDMDLDTYILISMQFRKMHVVEDLVQLYEVMMDGAYKPPVQHCAQLLNYIGYSSTPDINLVARVVKIHEAAGCALYKDVYDGVYNCLATAGRFCEADKILDAMRKAGFQPDKVTYDYTLFALGKAGKLEEAIRMMDEMKAKGYVPDLMSWRTLIRGQCTGSEIDHVLKCWAMLLEKNLEVDAEILNLLVNGLCTQRRVDCAYSLLTEAVCKANQNPLPATYTKLIQHLLSDRKFKEGINVLHLMKKHKLHQIINPFSDYISKFGTVENAMEFLEALGKHQSVPAYSHLLQALLKEGRESEAREFLQVCPHQIRKHVDTSNVFASLKPKNAPI